MFKKNLIRTGLVLVIILASLAIISSASKSEENEKCLESMEDCYKKQQKAPPSGEMIWESLPSRFFSSVDF